MTKKEVRDYIKNLISLNKNKLSDFSTSICKNVINSAVYKESEILLAYMALNDEVNLSLLIQNAIVSKKQVYIPRIIPDTNKMIFYKYNPEKIKEGSFGILEPDEENSEFEIKSYKEKILIIVPGRAFTKTGSRIGRGKGFYDNFLNEICIKNNSNLKTAGVCFSFQILENLPLEPHDKKVNFVISE